MIGREQVSGTPAGMRFAAGEPVLLAPLRVEALALRAGARGCRVERIGMGPARAEVARTRLRRSLPPGTPVAVVGFGGGLRPTDRAGDVVVATELLTSDSSRPPAMLDTALAARLEASLAPVLGRVRAGAVLCTPRLTSAAETASVAPEEALACEMESAWLAPLGEGRPFAVVRVIVDRPGRPLFGPWTLSSGFVAWRKLAITARVVAAQLEHEIQT